jgi:hypothetical protein
MQLRLNTPLMCCWGQSPLCCCMRMRKAAPAGRGAHSGAAAAAVSSKAALERHQAPGRHRPPNPSTRRRRQGASSACRYHRRRCCCRRCGAPLLCPPPLPLPPPPPAPAARGPHPCAVAAHPARGSRPPAGPAWPRRCSPRGCRPPAVSTPARGVRPGGGALVSVERCMGAASWEQCSDEQEPGSGQQVTATNLVLAGQVGLAPAAVQSLLLQQEPAGAPVGRRGGRVARVTAGGRAGAGQTVRKRVLSAHLHARRMASSFW